MCAVIVIVYLLNTFMFPSLWNTSQHKLSWNEDEDFQFWKSQAPPMANGQLETMIFGLSVNDWSLSSLGGQWDSLACLTMLLLVFSCLTL